MSRKPGQAIDIGKASLYAVVVNVAEIAVLIGFVVYLLWTDITEDNHFAIQWIAVLGAMMACWGAFLDIREALITRRRLRFMEDLEVSNLQMETLNHTLRAQRHDFLNHLQVVYSLMQMQEYTDATEYLDKVYGEIRSVSTFLGTKSTAVNALLKVKAGACEDHGVKLTMNIKSALEGLTMPAWELCRVLANLIDNAIDALKGAPEPRIELTIAEDLRAFAFTIANNGAPIPEEMRESIFEAGVSTKGVGRGMGLSIVRQTLAEYGGTVACQSDAQQTAFHVTVPK
ncbi:MAG: Spo0B domain-containing protein [Candidatus Limiplasma sp.]|nr:Spo0B domain-containing protein [Candidatus Limiplasma sp.]MEA5146571.1 Spo0B domain-containing protein [Candidatus Limiplasma sp.]